MNRDRILDAAFALLADGGLGALSMRRLADGLGVRVNTIYWHLASKQELLTELGARIAGVPSDATDGDGPGAVGLALLEELRARMLAVRDGAEVVAVARAREPGRIPAAARLAEHLVAEGMPGADARLLAEAAVVFTVGATIEEQTSRELERVEQSAVDACTLDRDQLFRTGVSAMLHASGRPTAVN